MATVSVNSIKLARIWQSCCQNKGHTSRRYIIEKDSKKLRHLDHRSDVVLSNVQLYNTFINLFAAWPRGDELSSVCSLARRDSATADFPAPRLPASIASTASNDPSHKHINSEMHVFFLYQCQLYQWRQSCMHEATNNNMKCNLLQCVSRANWKTSYTAISLLIKNCKNWLIRKQLLTVTARWHQWHFIHNNSLQFSQNVLFLGTQPCIK